MVIIGFEIQCKPSTQVEEEREEGDWYIILPSRQADRPWFI